MQASVPPPANGHASTSSNLSAVNGTYQTPTIRAEHLPPFQRTDINALKQELHDVLGDRGLPYWRALNGYLLGQIGRDELVSMVNRWLKGPQGMSHYGKGVQADGQSNCIIDYYKLYYIMPQHLLFLLSHQLSRI
jgi:hypothetical protein